LDCLLFYFTVVPYAALAILIPSMCHNIANQFSWVFCVSHDSRV
jgi:hypothetical protein